MKKIFDMDSKDAILILYDLVYPEFDDEKSDEENKGIMILDICFLQMN